MFVFNFCNHVVLVAAVYKLVIHMKNLIRMTSLVYFGTRLFTSDERQILFKCRLVGSEETVAFNIQLARGKSLNPWVRPNEYLTSPTV